jgi:sugar transferase (PEP-CTERM/EpsH1 system associated)
VGRSGSASQNLAKGIKSSDLISQFQMNILFVVSYPPSLIRVRSYNLIKSLTASKHQVTVLTLYTNEKERQDVEALKQFCYRVEAYPMPRWRSIWNCLNALPSHIPLQAVYSWQPTLANRMKEMLHPDYNTPPFDIIHVEHLRSTRYALALKSILQSTNMQIPIIWDSVDCISYLFEQASHHSHSLFGRLISRTELARTRWYEGWLAGQFDHVLITSQVDKQALLNLAQRERTVVKSISLVPNGVDLEYFKPDPSLSRKPSQLVFSGKMSYHANITMAQYLVQEIMPFIWMERPETELYIVGKDPSPAIQALGKNRSIIVTGTVKDIRPYLQQATIAVVPLIYGAGSQLKLLEAMACGTPVVTTSKAITALSIFPGRDLLVADEPQQFAQAVLGILADPEKQNALGYAGRRYVESTHNWVVIASKLADVYREVIE